MWVCVVLSFVSCVSCVCVASVVCVQRGIVGFERCNIHGNIVPATPYTEEPPLPVSRVRRAVDAEL